ncbi:MAG: sulfatase-like hydrolase/transferase [Myxococcales bacterium]|nr:sulfatase-like hydrolase/transferase [Myxococcales bacterium]
MPPPEVPESAATDAPPGGATSADATVRKRRPTVLSRRQAAAARRWGARALLLVPTAAVLTLDLGRRHARIGSFVGGDFLFYVVNVVLGLVLWASLLALASRVRGWSRWPARLAIVAAATLALGGQVYTFDRYAAYVNHRAVLVGTSMLPSIGQQLWFDRVTFVRTVGPCVLIALLLPLIAATVAPLRRRRRVWLFADMGLLALLTAAFVSPERGAEQGQPPDTMYVSAMGQLVRANWNHNETVARLHPGPRKPEPVPALTAQPKARRNVIMIVTESVRAHSVCLEYSEDCKWTPFSNGVHKDRMALTQMRALDSTTAISLAVMWSGLRPTESREALHTAPLLWEYARAAGLDTAYWTSQNLLFGNSGKWLEGSPWTRHVSATQIEADATYETGADDGKLVDYVLGDIGGLKEPYFAVVHLSNTHFPYKVNSAFMPFTPQVEATGPGYENQILNRYQDSIYLQDRALGHLLTELKKRPEAERTVLVYLSDHGEQMREKGAVGHTGTLYDPEIRIPFWVVAPKGTLTAAEEGAIRERAHVPTTMLDVFPTMMDLLGLWDAPGIKPFRGRVPGESLLRGGSPKDTPIVITNCTELWACAFKNWGAMAGSRKLIATQADRAWSCLDVATDPAEEHPLDAERCADLLPLAEGAGGRPF